MKLLPYISCLSLFLLSSCQLNQILGDDDVPTRIVRYDHIVNDYVDVGDFSAWQRMNMDFPDQTRLLVEEVLQMGDVADDSVGTALRLFYKDATLKTLRHDIKQKFRDLTKLEKNLHDAFRRLSIEAPSFSPPRFYAQNSALNQSIVVQDSILGISLDKYMGADYPLYKRFFKTDQVASMEPARIVHDCLDFYITSKLPPLQEPFTVGDVLVLRGKVEWTISHLLGTDLHTEIVPDRETHANHRAVEKEVWLTLKQQHLFDSTDSSLIRMLTDPACSQPFLNDARTRSVGICLGANLVNSYMKKHPEVSLEDLLTEVTPLTILRQSDYSPQ